MWFFNSKQRHSKSDVIKTLFFWLNIFFSLADNDTDISKTHLNKIDQIIKLDFYLRLQNTENFALSAWSDTLNPSCSCSLETENTEYYFLRRQNNSSLRTILMNDLNYINTAIASLNPNYLLRVNLYWDESFDQETNCKIITASIKFIKDAQRLEKSLI